VAAPLFRHVLHATDFSRASAKAFTTAVEVARATGASLTIAHVLTPVLPVATGEDPALPETFERVHAVTRGAAQQELDRLVERAAAAGVRATGVLLAGAPHDAIVRALKSRRADLAVIGTHGRTGLARVFVGSVAARVVALAPCPVLTVRGR
jgi:nucleotide-binding universal stress UspA family protein